MRTNLSEFSDNESESLDSAPQFIDPSAQNRNESRREAVLRVARDVLKKLMDEGIVFLGEAPSPLNISPIARRTMKTHSFRAWYRPKKILIVSDMSEHPVRTLEVISKV